LNSNVAFCPSTFTVKLIALWFVQYFGKVVAAAPLCRASSAFFDPGLA
jgi:hypothetical protein